MNEAAEMLHITLAGGGEYRAGAKEQQAFENRVIEDVKKGRGECQSGGKQHAFGLERERKPKSDEDDADIFNRMVGKKPFEIVLHKRIKHAHDGGDACNRQYDDAPPPRRCAGEIEDNAYKAVDGDLGHYAAHQSGDRAWRRRMGEREPDMKRYEAGVRARGG